MRKQVWSLFLGMALVAATALLGGDVAAAENKALPPDVGAGRIAWFDLTTTHLQRSRDFYSKLLDWRFTALAGSDQAVEIVAGGSAIGTLRVADGNITPYNGVVYVQVTDLTASCQKAKTLGGTIPPGFPFNLPDGTGAIALVIDPVGHPIGLYSRTPLPPKPTAKR